MILKIVVVMRSLQAAPYKTMKVGPGRSQLRSLELTAAHRVGSTSAPASASLLHRYCKDLNYGFLPV